jgi:hypothetical protein
MNNTQHRHFERSLRSEKSLFGLLLPNAAELIVVDMFDLNVFAGEMIQYIA